MPDHIAREGETEYASIHRNRSGQDAGQIDFGLRVAWVEELSDCDKNKIIKTARALYLSICRYCQQHPHTEGIIDNDCKSCSGEGCSCEKLEGRVIQ